jgi:hypothetical protein
MTPEPSEHDDGNVPGHEHNLRFADCLYRSRAASLLWLAVRLVLGYWWLNAGYQKIWGSEKAAFWFGGGAGVKGFRHRRRDRVGCGQEWSQLRLVGWLSSQLRESQRLVDRQAHLAR